MYPQICGRKTQSITQNLTNMANFGCMSDTPPTRFLSQCEENIKHVGLLNIGLVTAAYPS